MNSGTTHSPQLMRIGDVSKQTGKSVRAIHLYEELGLLQPTTRSSGGFRLYDPGVVERVHWIDLLHSLGFSLQEMRELVQAWWGAGLGPEAMNTLRSLFKRKLEETRQSVARYQQLERELADGLAYLETCRECPSAAATSKVCVRCEQDHGMRQEPALVAGLMSSAPGPAPRHPRASIVRVEDIE